MERTFNICGRRLLRFRTSAAVAEGRWAHHQTRGQRVLGVRRPGISHTSTAPAKFAVKGFYRRLMTDLRLNRPHIKCSCDARHIAPRSCPTREDPDGSESERLSDVEVGVTRERLKGINIDTVRCRRGHSRNIASRPAGVFRRAPTRQQRLPNHPRRRQPIAGVSWLATTPQVDERVGNPDKAYTFSSTELSMSWWRFRFTHAGRPRPGGRRDGCGCAIGTPSTACCRKSKNIAPASRSAAASLLADSNSEQGRPLATARR